MDVFSGEWLTSLFSNIIKKVDTWMSSRHGEYLPTITLQICVYIYLCVCDPGVEIRNRQLGANGT